jgi:hypothetical protein
VTDRYAVRLAPPARRALEDELPPAVAAAAWELISGPLASESTKESMRSRSVPSGTGQTHTAHSPGRVAPSETALRKPTIQANDALQVASRSRRLDDT